MPTFTECYYDTNECLNINDIESKMMSLLKCGVTRLCSHNNNYKDKKNNYSNHKNLIFKNVSNSLVWSSKPEKKIISKEKVKFVLEMKAGDIKANVGDNLICSLN